ncbi:MAG: phenylalanine--tRNA ligase subunit beta [Actinomycetota bacterium]|nr:phenylalanine--tRNA ligase subunit beta [Actinomycetota bacterium]
MKISLKWLEEYVRVNVPPKRLAELLTVSGTKVETILEPGAGIKGVVVSEVLAIDQHPNADNLTLVDITTGTDQERVVCGASNFAVGDKVPYAGVGARLPELEITERKIRGEVSRGMLCSAAELGVSKDHSGLLVLPSDATLGDDVVTTLGLDDVILELEVTPNRPDCMGMIGVAREVSALLGNELKIPEVSHLPIGRDPTTVTVKLADPVGCPRYVAHLIEDVTVGPSAGWMAARLLAAGIRPISNVVDATNYVLMETGHPLHAFDADRVHERTIVVRRAKKGERLSTLDGIERSLDAADLLITDPRKALALAGVMGGEDSEVSDATTTVLLESAYFDPASIGHTARRYGLRTEASARFERGADPEACSFAAARCAHFITLTAGARPPTEVVDAYPVPIERQKVSLRPRRTEQLLGIEVAARAQAERLRSIHLEVAEGDGIIEVVIPGFRPDITREVDLIEEVARLGGFDVLPETLPAGAAGGLEPDQRFDRTIRRQLVGFGLSEAWTSSLGTDSDLDLLQLADDHPARRMVAIANPMIEQEDRMRTTLLPGLLRSLARNVAHHHGDVALFEVARVYESGDGSLPAEPTHLGCVFSGRRRMPGWRDPADDWDFFAAKGVIDGVIDALGLAESAVYSPASGMPFHPTRAATVSIADHSIGVVGELHPSVCDTFEVPEGSLAMELDLAEIKERAVERRPTEDLPRFPATFIDIALVVPDNVPAAEVEASIRAAGAPELQGLRLFDRYRGEQIPADRKSLAYALELRVADRTLTDEDALGVRDRIVAAAKARFGAVLRA